MFYHGRTSYWIFIIIYFSAYRFSFFTAILLVPHKRKVELGIDFLSCICLILALFLGGLLYLDIDYLFLKCLPEWELLDNQVYKTNEYRGDIVQGITIAKE